MRPDIEELKTRIIHSLDVVELLDILGLEIADIVDLLEEHIEEHHTRLDRACR